MTKPRLTAIALDVSIVLATAASNIVFGQTSLGIKEFGVWRLRNQKITVHVNPLFIQAKGGPIKLLLARAEDISVSSGQLAPAPTVLVSEDFMAEGVANSRLFTNLFTGNFTAIDLNPNTETLLLVMNAYLYQYVQLCTPYLPANKVEIMSKECAKERVTRTRNSFGTIMTSGVCIEYGPARTNMFADPVLYDARVAIECRLAAGPANGDMASYHWSPSKTLSMKI